MYCAIIPNTDDCDIIRDQVKNNIVVIFTFFGIPNDPDILLSQFWLAIHVSAVKTNTVIDLLLIDNIEEATSLHILHVFTPFE